MKISIAIPTYNRLELLKVTMESVLSQSYSNFEVVVSDNNSDDGTVEYLKELSELDERVLVNVNDLNIGMVSNWDVCLEMASGDVFILLSDDDYFINNNVLEEVANYFKKYNPKVVVSDVSILKGGVLNSFQGGGEVLYRTDVFFEKYLNNDIRVYPCATFYNRKYIKNSYSSFGVKLACDACMLADALDFNDFVVYITRSLVVYRNHESLSSSHPDVWRADMDKYENILKEKGLISSLNLKTIFFELNQRGYLQYMSRLLRSRKYFKLFVFFVFNLFSFCSFYNFKYISSYLFRKLFNRKG